MDSSVVSSYESSVEGLSNDVEDDILLDADGTAIVVAIDGVFQRSVEGSFVGSTEGPSEGSVEDSFKGSVEGSFEGFVEDSFKGSVEGSFEVLVESSFDSSAVGSYEGSVEGSSEDVEDDILLDVDGRAIVGAIDGVPLIDGLVNCNLL